MERLTDHFGEFDGMVLTKRTGRGKFIAVEASAARKPAGESGRVARMEIDAP